MVRKAVILLGHGSRDPEWRRPIEAVAERLKQQHPGVGVRCAYMELQAPNANAAAAELAAAGAQHITVVPMFLGTGKHARDDLPVLIDELRRAHSAVRFELQPPVGEDPRLLDLLARIAAE